MAGYNKLSTLIVDEVEQLLKEGKKIDANQLNEEIYRCYEDKNKLMEIYHKIQNSPNIEDYKYVEPSLLEEIYLESDISLLPDDTYHEIDFDYFYGAWLGRCIGCAWGQPVEGRKSEEIITWYKNVCK